VGGYATEYAVAVATGFARDHVACLYLIAVERAPYQKPNGSLFLRAERPSPVQHGLGAYHPGAGHEPGGYHLPRPAPA
jgi:hypothetical protein